MTELIFKWMGLYLCQFAFQYLGEHKRRDNVRILEKWRETTNRMGFDKCHLSDTEQAFV